MKPGTFLLAVLDRGPPIVDQINVEGHEQSDKNGQHTAEQIYRYNHVRDSVVEGLRVCEGLGHCAPTCGHNQPTDKHTVADHAEKVLIVVKANAICHPGTVVVHLKHALVALGAVMAPVWLRFETPIAHAHAAKLLSLI